MSKETFKQFVRTNPVLATFVNRGEVTWQRFYEMYDLYGENHSIWNEYLNQNTKSVVKEVREDAVKGATTLADTSIKDIFNMVKSMDLDTVKKGVDGLQKAVGLLQEFTGTKKQEQYQARPLYKHLED